MDEGSLSPARPAKSYTISVALPGGDEHPAGVLLEDTDCNQLFVKMRDSWAGIVPDDYSEYLAAVNDDLCSKADEMGARGLIDYLTSSLSNFLRISDPETSMVSDFPEALALLYERKIQY